MRPHLGASGQLYHSTRRAVRIMHDTVAHCIRRRCLRQESPSRLEFGFRTYGMWWVWRMNYVHWRMPLGVFLHKLSVPGCSVGSAKTRSSLHWLQVMIPSSSRPGTLPIVRFHVRECPPTLYESGLASSWSSLASERNPSSFWEPKTPCWHWHAKNAPAKHETFGTGPTLASPNRSQPAGACQ